MCEILIISIWIFSVLKKGYQQHQKLVSLQSMHFTTTKLVAKLVQI